MAIRLSGNCDSAGRITDKNHTNVIVGELWSAHEQAGSLTMNEADRLCENEKEERNEEFQIMAGRKRSWVRGARVLLCSSCHRCPRFLAFPSRSTATSKCKCHWSWRQVSCQPCHGEWHLDRGGSQFKGGRWRNSPKPNRLERANSYRRLYMTLGHFLLALESDCLHAF